MKKKIALFCLMSFLLSGISSVSVNAAESIYGGAFSNKNNNKLMQVQRKNQQNTTTTKNTKNSSQKKSTTTKKTTTEETTSVLKTKKKEKFDYFGDGQYHYYKKIYDNPKDPYKDSNVTLNSAILKYKNGNYSGAIQELNILADKDDSNAVVFYYLGSAYMQTGKKADASTNFNKVIALSSVPQLLSYSVQANRCIEQEITKCEYRYLTDEQVMKIKADPTYLETIIKQESEGRSSSSSYTDVDKMIEKTYQDNIHPDAQKTIDEIKTSSDKVFEKVKKTEEADTTTTKKGGKATPKRPTMPSAPSTAGKNATKKKSHIIDGTKIAMSYQDKSMETPLQPSEREVLNAINTLKEAGYTFSSPEQTKQMEQIMQMQTQLYNSPEMAMFYDDNNGYNMNRMDMMLPIMIQQKNEDGTPKYSEDMIRSMMMNSMMNSYDFGLFDNNK